MNPAVTWALLMLVQITHGLYNCDPVNCTCQDGYEVDCPRSNHPVAQLKLKYLPGEAVKIVCSTTEVDYKWLQGVRVEDVPAASFTGCPLPDQPFRQLLSSWGIGNISKIIIQSNMNLDNVLQRQHFVGLNFTSMVSLPLNGLSTLPPRLFDGFRNLTELDLSRNSLQLKAELFNNVPNLVSLDLSLNTLPNLEPDVFQNLQRLEKLGLWGNNLTLISKTMFTGLKNLISLDLSSNQISSISQDAFSNMKKMKQLSLAWNNLFTLPELPFGHNPHLEVVELNDNKRLSILPDHFLTDLPALKYVNIENCNISQLSHISFWRSYNISSLRLSNNIISSLPRFLLKDAKNLLELHLSQNELATIPDYTFSRLSRLRVLNVDHNFLTNITRSMLLGLENLSHLNLSHNAIHDIHADAFESTSNLQVLSLSHNILSFHAASSDEEGSPMHPCNSLQELHLDHNQIMKISPDWKNHTSLQYLNLSYNSIAKVEFQDLYMKSKNITVDLSHNQIKTIDLSEAESTFERDFPAFGNVNIKIDNNPLECDCQIYDFLRYLELKIAPEVHAAVNIVEGNLVCTSPPSMVRLSVNELNSDKLYCRVSEQCPEQCLCLLHASDHKLVVNCSGQGLKEIPQQLPENHTISNIELDLDHNFIQTLPESLPSSYSKVTELSLSHNNILNLRNSSLPENLQLLQLDHNNLAHLDDSTVDYLSSLQRITLNNNPWDCNCDQLHLITFLKKQAQQVEYIEEVVCAGMHNTQLQDLSERDLCSKLYGGMEVAAGVAISMAATVLGVLAVLYLNYQKRIRKRLYACKM